MADLAQLRDELALKMHLAKADTRDEWDKIEAKFREWHARVKPAEDVAKETAQDVGSALLLAGEEIRNGFERIRKLL